MFVILFACLTATPTTCEETRIQQSVEERPPFACIAVGESTIARWQQEHPRWVIKRWKCVPRSRLDTPL